MRRIKPWLAGVGFCVAGHTAALDFETVGDLALVGNTYSASSGITFSGAMGHAFSASGIFEKPPYDGANDGTVIGFSGAIAPEPTLGSTGSIVGFGPNALSMFLKFEPGTTGFVGFNGISFEYSAKAAVRVYAYEGASDISPEFFNLVGNDQAACSNDALDMCVWNAQTFSFGSTITELRFFTSANGNPALFDNMEPNMVNMPSAVPEPSTYALMALGLAGIAAISRRRRKEA